MQRQSAERVRREIIRLCHAGLDSRTLRIEIIKQLRKVIPIDVFFFTTADPATLLFTGAVVDEILERATPLFLQNEFLLFLGAKAAHRRISSAASRTAPSTGG